MTSPIEQRESEIRTLQSEIDEIRAAEALLAGLGATVVWGDVAGPHPDALAAQVLALREGLAALVHAEGLVCGPAIDVLDDTESAAREAVERVLRVRRGVASVGAAASDAQWHKETLRRLGFEGDTDDYQP